MRLLWDEEGRDVWAIAGLYSNSSNWAIGDQCVD